MATKLFNVYSKLKREKAKTNRLASNVNEAFADEIIKTNTSKWGKYVDYYKEKVK